MPSHPAIVFVRIARISLSVSLGFLSVPLFISLGRYTTSQLSASASVTSVHIQNQSFLSGRFRIPVCSTINPFSYLGPLVRKNPMFFGAHCLLICFCCDTSSSVIRRLASAFLACGKGNFWHPTMTCIQT
jgi:hypothetical protein